jgi:hypothetical protein
MMRKWVVPILLILMLLVPAAVRAQSTITLASVEVDLWPEYDRPTMLVIYHLFLNSDTQLPATMTLRIPSSAGDPYNVAVREADGQLYNAAFTRTVLGNWSLVTVTATATELQFEYYDPDLVKNGASRSFVYEWQGDYAVKAMTIQAQQPVGASQMKTTPSLGSGFSGEGGLTYYTAMVGAVPAGTKFKLSLEYQKNDDTLSAPSLEVQPSAPISSTTPGRTPSPNIILAWLLGGLGVLLLVGGGIWYWRAGWPAPNTQLRRKHAPRADKLAESEADDAVYCHQCGRRASPGDIFCRACGTKLRREES